MATLLAVVGQIDRPHAHAAPFAANGVFEDPRFRASRADLQVQPAAVTVEAGLRFILDLQGLQSVVCRLSFVCHACTCIDVLLPNSGITKHSNQDGYRQKSSVSHCQEKRKIYLCGLMQTYAKRTLSPPEPLKKRPFRPFFVSHVIFAFTPVCPYFLPLSVTNLWQDSRREKQRHRSIKAMIKAMTSTHAFL